MPAQPTHDEFVEAIRHRDDTIRRLREERDTAALIAFWLLDELEAACAANAKAPRPLSGTARPGAKPRRRSNARMARPS